MKHLARIAAVAALGIALFAASSSYAYDRMASRTFGLIAGLVVFPVVPLGWHLIGELRGRRRATPRRGTGWLRLGLRLGAVALAVVAAIGAVGRDRIWLAMTSHGWWWLHEPPALADAAMLRHVPRSAEALVWLRSAALRDVLPNISDDDRDDAAFDAVTAADAHDGMYATRGGALPIMNASMLLAMRWSLANEPGPERRSITAPDGVKIVASPAWADPVVERTAPPSGGAVGPGLAPTIDAGPSPELRALLARVPDDALVVAVGRPAAMAHDPKPASLFTTWIRDSYRLDRTDVRTAVAWLRKDGDDVEVRVILEATDDAAAARLVDDIRDLANLVVNAGEPDCERELARQATAVHLDRSEATIDASLRVPIADSQRWSACRFGTPLRVH